MTAKVKHLVGIVAGTTDSSGNTVTASTSLFILKLPPYYGGTDNNINVGSILGINLIVPGTTTIPNGTSLATTGQLLKSGVIRLIKVRVGLAVSGSAVSTTKIKRMYCLAQNAPNVSQIIGGTFTTGYLITDAWLPEHFTYGA